MKTEPDHEEKRPRGRPVEKDWPEPIPDTPENVANALVRAKPTAQITKINENSKELGDKIGENAKELGVLQEKVSRVEKDIGKLEDKIDELRGFSRTSYQPAL